uniref:Uncharacterized protein n=1 Tax=Alexandrium catenella TaxID=2925 RepID=A0A7S1WTQ4_ALECA|mmetsp:Transcript_89550/g.237846  ORF Transcript_89550/g.237846 Transcript_89550/m.237846 type:complete len:227 (+) Transcript_89550:157-837(+)
MQEVDSAYYVLLLTVALIIVGCSLLIYTFELYRLHPSWAPIHKFDGLGNEDLRISQGVIHQYVDSFKDLDPLQEYLVSKGSFETDAPGLGYRFSRTLEDKVGDDVFVEWGTAVRGTTSGDGWLQVEGMYLPMMLDGCPVVHLQSKTYGSLGKSTWGTCEVPWMQAERIVHPVHGEVTMRHGFADTQFLRQHSATWARDEPHFIQEAGLSCPVSIKSYGSTMPQSMV